MNSDELKRKLGIDDDGTYRINPETGVVQKQGWFGWSDTDKRVDPNSGDVQERGWFGWNRTDANALQTPNKRLEPTLQTARRGSTTCC